MCSADCRAQKEEKQKEQKKKEIAEPFPKNHHEL
jgi:hypothetical protein